MAISSGRRLDWRKIEKKNIIAFVDSIALALSLAWSTQNWYYIGVGLTGTKLIKLIWYSRRLGRHNINIILVFHFPQFFKFPTLKRCGSPMCAMPSIATSTSRLIFICWNLHRPPWSSRTELVVLVCGPLLSSSFMFAMASVFFRGGLDSSSHHCVWWLLAQVELNSIFELRWRWV